VGMSRETTPWPRKGNNGGRHLNLNAWVYHVLAFLRGRGEKSTIRYYGPKIREVPSENGPGKRKGR